jgi:hypothetical protein
MCGTFILKCQQISVAAAQIFLCGRPPLKIRKGLMQILRPGKRPRAAATLQQIRLCFGRMHYFH